MAAGVNQSLRGPITTSRVMMSLAVGSSKAGPSLVDTLQPALIASKPSRSPAFSGGGPTWARLS